MGSSPARTRRHGARRLAAAAGIAAAATAAAALVVPGRAAATTAAGGRTAVPTAPSPAATTPPPLPDVPAADTDGHPAQTLLANALTLASVGVDDAALAAAVSATQSKLDADAVAARGAEDRVEAAQAKERAAQARAAAASEQYDRLDSAVRQAALYFYMAGPQAVPVSPRAGALALYAQDYLDSTVEPYGVLDQRRAAATRRDQALRAERRDAEQAAAAARTAEKALNGEAADLARLESELASVSAATAAKVAADHAVLAGQAGRDLLSHSSLQFTPKAPVPAPLSTTPLALSWAFAELGQPYVWGATGPDSFDCSGLTQFVWKAAGVPIPRVAADQYAWTIPVPLSQLLPGDLVFFGTTDIHHVGVYIGDGLMVNAPHTGTVVQVSSIWWSDLAGFGRVHAAGIPVPAHHTPTTSAPARPTVIPGPGPIPSQTAPPPGWKPQPKPSGTNPIGVADRPRSGPTTSTAASIPISSREVAGGA